MTYTLHFEKFDERMRGTKVRSVRLLNTALAVTTLNPNGQTKSILHNNCSGLIKGKQKHEELLFPLGNTFDLKIYPNGSAINQRLPFKNLYSGT